MEASSQNAINSNADTSASDSAKSSETEANANAASAREVKTEHINIKVKDQSGHEIHFKVKRSTQFYKVTQAYSAKIKSPVDATRFLFDGQRIPEMKTIEEIGLEDDDVIDAMVSQVGGSC